MKGLVLLVLLLGTLFTLFYIYPLSIIDVINDPNTTKHDDRRNKIINYERFGNPNAKHKLIFIVGLGTGWHWWDRNVEYFNENHGNTTEVLVIDNRGSGKSSDIPFTWRYSMTDMAKDVLTILRELKWLENDMFQLNVIAQSMGGLVATELVRLEKELYPKKSNFNSITLQNTFRTVFSTHAAPMLDTTLFLLKQVTVGLVSLEIRMRLVLEQMFSADFVNKNYDDLYKRYSHLFADVRTVGQVKQTLGIMTHYISENDFTNAYENISKIILINSAYDRMVHTGNTKHLFNLLSGKPNREIITKYYETESNGHIINSEQHSSYNEFLYNNLIKIEN